MSDDDFKSYKELGKQANAPECSRCGVSVYNTLEKARYQLGLRPYLGKRIAKGHLEEHHGKLSIPKSSGHMDWWPYVHVVRHSCFSELSS